MRIIGLTIILTICATVSAVVVQDLIYYLYTLNNLNSPEIVYNNDANKLSTSMYFDETKKIVFIIHGWAANHTAQVNQLIKTAAFQHYDINIILLDWSSYASLSYRKAKAAAPAVGQLLGVFINDMMTIFGLNGTAFTLIGYSIGAHIAGNAGSTTLYLVDHILALDAAAPFYNYSDLTTRLDPSDGDYVQVIHTAGVFPGFVLPLGDVDYYPNGGILQPNCGLDFLGRCSHRRSIYYVAEAIAGPDNFTAVLCPKYYHVGGIHCPTSNPQSFMGKIIDIDKSIVGNYYVKTRGQSPFAQG